MTRKALPYAVLMVAVIALAIGYLFKSCQRDPGEKIPAHTAKTIDSLDRTARGFDSSQKIIITRVVHDTVQSNRLQETARSAEGRARVAQSRADSLARVASTSADSATAWRGAYEARSREAEELRVSVIQKDSALVHERSALLHLSEAYGADTLRRIAIESVNRDLRLAIERLEVPCRVIGPVRCPGRVAVAVASAIAGAAVGSRF
jgi:hypothetical protein